MKKVITLTEIKAFATELFISNNGFPKSILNQLGFEYYGTWIINPWMDDTGRFELTDAQAIELYGKDNIDSYIEKVAAYLENL